MNRFVSVGIFFAMGVGCGGPRAAPIGGDIALVLERGIEHGSGSFDHSTWDELVGRHVRNDGRRFDYTGLKADEDELDAYLRDIATVELASLAASEIQALFANAYNAYTIKTVLDHMSSDGTFAIDSILDVPDVFVRADHVVGGFSLSLDNIEHNVLRPLFKDPRFHFAVNCASISCPPVPTRAFTGEELDEQLDRVTRNALTDSDYVAVDGDALLVTKIMEWYRDDFVNPEYSGSEPTLAGFIANYATPDVRNFITSRDGNVSVKYRDYDWRLNKP